MSEDYCSHDSGWCLTQVENGRSVGHYSDAPGHPYFPH